MSFQREIDIRGQNTSPATWTGQRIAGGAEADDPDAPSADGSQTVWSSLTVSDGDDAFQQQKSRTSSSLHTFTY